METSAGERTTFDIGFFLDDQAAADHARRLLADRPRYQAVAVFDGERSFRVERPSA